MSTPTPDQTHLPASAWPYKPKADTNTDGAGKALLEALREQAPGGQFLFNRTGLWHQGIHIGAGRLSGKFDTDQVCAIADGEVIAYKVDSAYPINQTSEDSAEYSTGYFLLKHEIKYPADNFLTFYSLYRHTAKADDYPKAEIYTVQSADGSIGIKDGTNNTVITLSDGNDDQIMIDPTRSISNKRRPILAYKENGKDWVSGDGLTVFHTSYDSASKQDGGPLIPVLAGIEVQADQDVTLTTPIKVKAGSILGKPGIYQQLKQSDTSKLIQLDVFTYNDIIAFAEKAKTASEQAEQAQAVAATTTAAANTVAGTTGTAAAGQASNQAILQPLPKNLLVIPKGSDLFQKIQITKTIAGTGGGATLRAPDGTKIDGTPETPSVDDLPPDTPITIEEAANSKKRHKVLTINHQAPAQEVTIHESEYAQQTDFMHMESMDSAKTAYALLIPANELPTAEEGPDKKKYYNIKSWYPTSDGYEYVREDHLQRGASLEWLKYYDQSEGDKIGIFQDTVAYWDIESDGTLDEKEALNPLFKQLLLDLHMDTDGDGELSKKEAGQLKVWSMKQEMAADILKAAIKHSNEWRRSNVADMQGFLDLIRKQAPDVAQAHQERLQALQIPTVANVDFDTPATFIHPMAMIFGLTIKREKKKWSHSEFGNLIAKKESSDDYNKCNQTKGGLKVINNIKVVNLTISEMQEKQKNRDVFAIGRYQLIPTTLNSAILSLSLDTNKKLDEEMQDKIFDEYLIKIKRPNIIAYLEGSGTVEDAMYDSAKEWASIGVEKGRRIKDKKVIDKNGKKTKIARYAQGGESFYADDGLNKAHITPEEIKATLINSKNENK